MTRFLAIDTATDACSVALGSAGDCREVFELAPRRHNQLLFTMLDSLLGPDGIAGAAIDALVYSAGPGSFTGLRVGASAVQGLAFSNQLPVVAVPTLTGVAQSALRRGLVGSESPLLALLDARVGEVYWQLFDVRDGICEARDAPGVCSPAALPTDIAVAGLQACGDGLGLIEQFPELLRDALAVAAPECWPCAQDLLLPAQMLWRKKQIQRPEQVAPVYVRDEISWKKLSEQGPRQEGRR